MLRNFLLPVVIVFLSVLPAGAAEPAGTAGRVEFVTGDTWFVDASQQKRRPGPGDILRESDMIVTGIDGEVHLDMEDGGYLAVRPHTQIRVDAYRAQGDKDDRAVFNLIKGAMRSFTGWILKVSPRNYQIRTVTAAVGVRGTDHETLFIPQGSDIGEPGTYDKVNEGATFISHASGQVDVLPGNAGFAPLAPGSLIRLLERIPEFFRPTPNEYLLVGKHKLVQERLQERLDARRRLSKPQPQQDAPKSEPPGEMQEAPASPEGKADLRDAPSSSLPPSVPAAPLPAAGAAVPAVPAVAAPAAATAVPAAAPAALSAPAVSAPAVPAVVPASRTVTPAAAVSSESAAAPKAVAPAAKEQTRPAAASRSRGVQETEKPATDRAPARAAQPTESERERIYKERRKKQLEREGLYDRDSDADRMPKRSRESN